MNQKTTSACACVPELSQETVEKIAEDLQKIAIDTSGIILSIKEFLFGPDPSTTDGVNPGDGLDSHLLAIRAVMQENRECLFRIYSGLKA